MCQNLVPLVNIKIAGKWMLIPLKMVLIGIDPYPYIHLSTIGIPTMLMGLNLDNSEPSQFSRHHDQQRGDVWGSLGIQKFWYVVRIENQQLAD